MVVWRSGVVMEKWGCYEEVDCYGKVGCHGEVRSYVTIVVVFLSNGVV